MLTCRYAPQLVKTVVEGVLDRLGRPALHVADMPMDLDHRVAAIKQQLAELSATGSAVLGLYGMGCIGKTTLAKAVFNDLRSGFVGSSCFVEVGKDPGKLQQVQRQMLRELCGIEGNVSSIDAGKAALQTRLGTARVLLVIDDVWSTAQLDALLIGVGQGSHVLVTTRDEDLLRRPSVSVREPVELLGKDAARELLSWCAFLQKEPPAAYNELANKAVQACSGCRSRSASLERTYGAWRIEGTGSRQC